MLTYWQEEKRPEWLKGVRRMGRYRKYRTDKALREMVEAYFRSISREKLVMEAYNTGGKDAWGHFVFEWRPVSDLNGVYMREREYVIPPTVGGLCAFLEISRSTWHEYCQEEKFRETTEWAREQMLSWREEQLLRRPGKMLKGLTLDLQANYGYARRLAVGKGDQGQVGADSGPSAAGMTTAEKMALLREMAGVIGNGEDPG